MTVREASIHCTECHEDVPYLDTSWRAAYAALAAHRREKHPAVRPTVRRPA